MVCSVCGSENIAAVEFFRNWKDEIRVVWDCHDCGFYDYTESLLELRNRKLKKILKCQLEK